MKKIKKILLACLLFLPFVVFADDITGVTVSSDGVISWDAVAGAGSYDVGDGGTWSGLRYEPSTEITWKDNHEDNTEYSFTINAYSDNNGANSIATYTGHYLYRDGEFIGSDDYHSITFESNEGPAVAKRYYVRDEATVEPTGMEVEGLYFNGWYRDIDTRDRFTWGNPLGGDETLYAWYTKEEEEPQYTVIYDLNGGHGPEGETKYTTKQVAYVPFITTENFVDYMSVTPPEGETLIAIEIDGKRYEVDKGLGYELNKDTTYVYIWSGTDARRAAEEDNGPKEKYTVTNGSYSVEFEDGVDQKFELNVLDVLTLKKEELAELGVTEEQFNEILKAIKESTKEYGTLVSVFAIEVNGENGRNYTGKTIFKIKLTEEMKKYNKFKLIYLDDENNFKVGEIVDFKIEGDYLVGTLPHLSAYALVGEYVEESKNPKTGDTIINSVIMLSLCLTGLVGGIIYIKKRKTNN